ncbi:DMT family transporter [Acuticoccus sp. MNP-M23]|uniref:DMT family transporter n=1 Tax=Acuticoccus sp. MNP-M23 TaxID=3072793 RepID=UPI0028155340|nr:DMT family transporter [Acuticoccus sp. MNP-M23]WMS43300.1 DMT family transporter [Acuticoccus sp. MNP-M23]
MRAILLMMVAAGMFACLDATAKFLGEAQLLSIDIVWLRYSTHVILLGIFLRVWSHFEAFRTRRPWMQLLRGLHLLGATYFNFWALKYLQLAEASAIMFCSPLIVTALAGPILGEKVGIRRWAAVGVGFVGVLIVTRPGMGVMHWAIILSLISVFNYAMYALLTRKMNKTESAESLLMMSALVGVFVLSPVAYSAVSSLTTPKLWTLAFMMGLFGAVGHYALVVAHRTAGASTLAPFIYTQMVWMILFGFLIFGDVPDTLTIVGTAIIAGAGLYILHRERVRGQVIASHEPEVQ